MNFRPSKRLFLLVLVSGGVAVLVAAGPLLADSPLVAAGPPPADSPDEWIRQANALFATDPAAADALYAAAEERTTDPGLVAFNRAAVLFHRGDYREAERYYDRVLADAACPPHRSAQAWYNRGTCLLVRGGSLSVYRSAIACLENALQSPGADDPLKAKARHNLEIAKLRWIELAQQEAKSESPSPNQNVPPEENARPPSLPRTPDSEPGHEAPQPTSGSPLAAPPMRLPLTPSDQHLSPSEKPIAGHNPNLLIPQDSDIVQRYSPEEAREYLKRTAPRRQREYQALLQSLYGAERIDIRDW
ncbi:MAG: tetratricopeptide repeat protein [Gemmataceae bacterium]|nr:tetratricopeptide repeat protein [Gemmata sp.]MDW8198438.1 tetratricopeptide repeat protein [Gemmataceae bacterium]